LGLIGAPDPAAEAPLLLQAALRPELAVTPNIVWSYWILRQYPFVTAREPNAAPTQFHEEQDRARAEFLAAVRGALDTKQGGARATTLLTLLMENPHDPELRARLVAQNKDLTRAQITEIVNRWENLGGKDFLPIIRVAAQPPLASAPALGLLATLAPEEARALIVQDLARDKPLYIDRGQGRYATKPLERLPDRELPELDAVFRRKLRTHDADLFSIMPLVARYATTNLLSDVVAVYKGAEGRWACDIEAAVLQYWIRCAPAEGLEAMAAALKSRATTGCYHSVLSAVLLENWTDQALPIVLAALQDQDADVVDSASRVLERHAPSDVAPQVTAAIRRLLEAPIEARQFRWRAQSMSNLLLESKRWHLSQEQRDQITACLVKAQKPNTAP
jgi:hypothetical protein